MHHQSIDFLPFSAELAPHFERINRQWIEAMFVMEQADRDVLSQPQQKVIDTGGQIWFAHHPQLGVVGTCALMNKGQGAYELTKMGVVAEARSLKIGEKLLQHVLQQARSMPIHCLFLLTNKRCEAAIHLYQKNGFEHSQAIMQRFGQAYARCDVAMRYRHIGG